MESSADTRKTGVVIPSSRVYFTGKSISDERLSSAPSSRDRLQFLFKTLQFVFFSGHQVIVSRGGDALAEILDPFRKTS